MVTSSFSSMSDASLMLYTPYEILVIVLICSLSPFTILGNVLVIVSYGKDKRIRDVPFNLYILNLAIADLLVGLVSIPSMVYYLFKVEEIALQSFSYYFLIWIIRFPLFLSVFLIILMTFDRLSMISDPVKYKINSNNKKNVKYLVVTWLLSSCYVFSYVIPDFLAALAAKPLSEDSDTNEIRFVVFVSSFGHFFINFVIPMAILSLMNIMFIVKVRGRLNLLNENLRISYPNTTVKTTPIEEEGSSTREYRDDAFDLKKKIAKTFEGGGGRHNRNLQKRDSKCDSSKMKENQHIRKISRGLLLLVIVYVSCWVPPHMEGLLEIYFVKPLPSIVFFIGLLILYTNSVVNPIIYAATNSRYREGMLSVLRRRGCVDTSVSTSEVNGKSSQVAETGFSLHL